MPNATTISADDTAPYSHVFSPISVDAGRAVLKNRDGQISAGDETLTLTYSDASSKRPTNKVSVRLDIPLERVIDGVNTVDGTARLHCEFVLPDNMSQTERQDFMAVTLNTLGNPAVFGYVHDLDPLY